MKKLFAILLCVTLFMSGIGAYAADNKDNTNSEAFTEDHGYLTEEEVFAALAVTYGDSKLMEELEIKQYKAPNGFVIEGFHAGDYNEYMNNQYGGMFLNENGGLVLCYVNGTKALSVAEKRVDSISSTLFNAKKETVAETVIVKGVKYSYQNLIDACEKLNTAALKLDGINQIWVDIENNRIVVDVDDNERGYKAESELRSVVDKEMVFFTRTKDAREIKFIATINGTSAINNGSHASTPAGQMYSSSKGNYGIITCGHGYSNGNSIYSGLTTNTRIGNITDRVFSTSNDASYIVLSSGHSYSGSKVDEISSSVPVVNSYLTLRGYVSGTISSAKVTSTNASFTVDGTTYTGHIRVDKGLQEGDSGGGAIGGVIDGGRTNLIVGINRAANGSEAYLVKGSVVLNAFN
jgi:hypothetical protein